MHHFNLQNGYSFTVLEDYSFILLIDDFEMQVETWISTDTSIASWSALTKSAIQRFCEAYWKNVRATSKNADFSAPGRLSTFAFTTV